MSLPFAVFAVAFRGDGTTEVAGTTRAADRGEHGRIGLPGGKVDPGESPVEALVRECAEEGWALSGVSDTPVHVAEVDGRLVHWYSVWAAGRLSEFKEQGRIQPLWVKTADMAVSGYGNEWLEKYVPWGDSQDEDDAYDALKRERRVVEDYIAGRAG